MDCSQHTALFLSLLSPPPALSSLVSSSIDPPSPMSTNKPSLRSQISDRFHKRDSSQPGPRYVHIHDTLYWALITTTNRIFINGATIHHDTEVYSLPHLFSVSSIYYATNSVITIDDNHLG